jgi:hypothetical protein
MIENTDLEELKKITEIKFNIKDLFRNTRKREYVYARAVFFSLARKVTFRSYEDIANFANRNHATVIHSVKLYNYSVAPFKSDKFCNRYITAHEEIIKSYSDFKNEEEDLRLVNEAGYYKKKYHSCLEEISRLNQIIDYLWETSGRTKQEKKELMKT